MQITPFTDMAELPIPNTDQDKLEEVQLPAETLRALVQKIDDSGALGRSKVYIDLLRYLCESAIEGKTPKEIVIAIDVMGKDSDFDVKNDSLVRVYMHKLRQKLEHYYQRQGKSDPYQLIIPKGRYTLSVVAQESATQASATLEPTETLERAAPVTSNQRLLARALMFCAALLALNVLVSLFFDRKELPQLSKLHQISQHPIWAPMLADGDPVMLVIGDYYVFGEKGRGGRNDRLVREYHINSSAELTQHISQNVQLGAASPYYDLNLSYLPRATAFALKDIMPILAAAGKQVDVRMVSTFEATDLKTHHILYIGYISAMGDLQDLPFESSAFAIGNSFDELVNRESGEVYRSNEIPPKSKGEIFNDYGMISSFPMLTGRQMMFISGTRDTGVMHMAQIASSSRYLQAIAESLPAEKDSNNLLSFEAFYRVLGVEGHNFDAENIHIDYLNYSRIWGGEMMEVVE